MTTLLWLAACAGTEPTSVANAPATRAAYLTLTDAQIDFAHAGVWERYCNPGQPTALKGATGCVELHFFVLPVRGAVADGPVTAWVSCDKAKTLGACKTELQATSPLTGRVVSRVGGRDSGWQKAIADAHQRHGLTSAPDAPVIQPKRP